MTHKTVITWICDLCETEQTEQFLLGGLLRFDRNLQDYQGAVVAGQVVTKELCDECTTTLTPMLNELLEVVKRKSQRPTEEEEGSEHGEPGDMGTRRTDR